MNSFPLSPRFLATLLAAALLVPAAATATERRFTYTYGSGVLGKGDVELEPWTTFRIGREAFFVRLDHRFEFEMGVTDRVQTAWYLNWHTTTAAAGDALATEFEWSGVSNEWKFKLSDPVADPIGLGLYAEWGAGPREIELEGKLLLDKQAGPLYVAFNLVGEYEVEWEEPGETESEVEIETDLGIGLMPKPSVLIGAEFTTHTEIVPGEGYEHTAFFLGPAVSFAQKKWWAALSVLPQLGAAKSEEHAGDTKLDLHEHERVQARLLLGFHI